jgi:biotin synthase
MCGLPGQTVDDLARDILFFADMDVDMIGMGPFIPHAETPLADAPFSAPAHLLLGLKMIAATRLHLHDVNIAASTALQALAPDGRERGLAAGANVLMPNLTDVAYRERYRLYDGKPCRGGEGDDDVFAAWRDRLAAAGFELALGRRGDSLHYARRTEAER